MKSHPVNSRFSRNPSRWSRTRSRKGLATRKWLTFVLLSLAALSLAGLPTLRRVEFWRQVSAQQGITPAIAFPILYLVDSTGDGDNVPLNGTGCNDGTNHSTLRAAIRAANNHSDVTDTISFDLPVPSTINLTKALPDLSDSVSINCCDRLSKARKCRTSTTIRHMR